MDRARRGRRRRDRAFDDVRREIRGRSPGESRDLRWLREQPRTMDDGRQGPRARDDAQHARSGPRSGALRGDDGEDRGRDASADRAGGVAVACASACAAGENCVGERLRRHASGSHCQRHRSVDVEGVHSLGHRRSTGAAHGAGAFWAGVGREPCSSCFVEPIAWAPGDPALVEGEAVRSGPRERGALSRPGGVLGVGELWRYLSEVGRILSAESRHLVLPSIVPSGRSRRRWPARRSRVASRRRLSVPRARR